MAHRILIVDNTTAIMNPWKDGLAKRFQTSEAFGGIEAVRKLKTENYAAVIVNISLRQLNGVEAISKIRSTFDKIPIIVLYDKKDILDLKQAQAYSVDAILPLPVDYKRLLEELEAVLPSTEATAPERTEADSNRPQPILQKHSVSNSAVQNPPPNGSASVDVEALYYDALTAISHDKIPQAIQIFETIVKVNRLKRETWRRLVEESFFQLGQCYAALKQYEKSNYYYATFINKAPHNSSIKSALLYMGKNYLALNNKGKAALYFKKVIALQPVDSFTTQARKLLKLAE